MTVRQAAAHGNAELKNAGIETYSLDSSILLCSCLNTGKTGLLAMGEEALDENTLAAFYTLIKRRKEGECIAYILGKKEFFGLEFLVNSSVLVPRPDTEILVEAAIEILKKEAENHNKKSKIRVLDLCTGSGAIAIALKSSLPQIEIHAADISAEAIEVAKENANLLLGKNTVNFYHGDLFDALPAQQYSLIVSNPPYIASNEIKTLRREVQKEPRIALDGGISGLSIIERIIERAHLFLKRGGIILIEADPRQMKKIESSLEKRNFRDIKLYKDLSGRERVIGGKYEM
ncbi:MAG: peptide chain release factor N(5)-glutamine methyltransferase [Treponema sp.]|jgi:release factor glutamine methyltransferase|nr:peptide chain release factor N(5)-glutamine methyltransferase [Treponema sp.]